MKANPKVLAALQTARDIKCAMSDMTYREREVLALLYGLGDGYTYTLEEVGRIFKTTRERVRQVRDRGLKKLEARLVEPQE